MTREAIAGPPATRRSGRAPNPHGGPRRPIPLLRGAGRGRIEDRNSTGPAGLGTSTGRAMAIDRGRNQVSTHQTTRSPWLSSSPRASPASRCAPSIDAVIPIRPVAVIGAVPAQPGTAAGIVIAACRVTPAGSGPPAIAAAQPGASAKNIKV